ncbi:MAG: thioredoxin domain-containing protein [Desulfobacterales bacterium]
MTDPSRRPNRLIHEKSPYLQQHAHNPVDWFPWGEEALQEAKTHDRPILLSIGYSTCHWCHVMEEESFSDLEIARLMNRHFVCIKVDREERPDLDQIYMNAVTALTGSGGWPLNVFLTPDLDPFYGGTYFPPTPRHAGMPSWPDLLRQVSAAWADMPQRERIRDSGAKVTRILKERLSWAGRGSPPDKGLLKRAVEKLAAGYDSRWGGFSPAPKFPSPSTLTFLLTFAADAAHPETRDPLQRRSMEMAVHTLERMGAGGIFDQLGGGFHRYSTDAQWLVPHFEKMLYDNAQLIPVYLLAADLAGSPSFARIARRTAEYVLQEMTHPDGGFYSAQDADSLPPEAEAVGERKREGSFFLWTRREIIEIAGEAAGEIFCRRFGVEPDGNVAFDPHGEFRGKNILHKFRSVAEIARETGSPPETVDALLAQASDVLFQHRLQRPKPHLDDKILTAWNGLMISALARCGQVLEDRRYGDAARNAAEFVLERLYDPQRRFLYRRWRKDERRIPGTAEDYFFLIQGLIDLYESEFEPRWLERALELTEAALTHFHDDEGGGFFMTRADHDPHLILRAKEDMDLVIPSAASVAAVCLTRLSRLTGRTDLEKTAEETIQTGLSRFESHPDAVTTMLTAMIQRQAESVQIVIAGDPAVDEARALLKSAREHHLNGKTLILLRKDEDRRVLGRRLPFLNSAVEVDGRPAAYVCIGRSCKAPVAEPEALKRLLSTVTAGGNQRVGLA